MVIAYILAIVRSGAEKEVIDTLKKEAKIKEVHMVYGEFDVVAKIELDSISDLSDFVLDKIRAIPYIEKTTTLIVAG
ncbi:MAG: Lrp/AsnC ligand binding domain-containing protein [Candidatus Nanoarchaeia archaeon]